MFTKIATLCATAIITVGCASSEYSTTVKPMQRKDKQLSCKEVLLEMNEADFYRKTALKNRGPKLKNILMPLGYISTYMSSEEAIEAADARVAYLDQIYEIMHCSDKESISASVTTEETFLSAAPAQVEYVQPTYYYQQPVAPVAGYYSPYGR